jgi:ribonuclease P protein component
MVKTVSLKMNYEFMRVYKKGKFYVGKFIILYVLPNKLNINRIGFTVNKKIGKSVKRNRFKRLVKENYRFFEPYIKDSYDFVIVARNNLELPDFNVIRKEMKFLLRKLNVFDQEKWDCSKML